MIRYLFSLLLLMIISTAILAKQGKPPKGNYCNPPPDVSNYEYFEGHFILEDGEVRNLASGKNGLYVKGKVDLESASILNGHLYATDKIDVELNSVVNGSVYGEGDIHTEEHGQGIITGEECEKGEPIAPPSGSYCENPPDVSDYTLYVGNYVLAQDTRFPSTGEESLYITEGALFQLDSDFYGDVYAVGDIELKNKAVIYGSVYSQNGVVLRGSTSEITGEICENGPVISPPQPHIPPNFQPVIDKLNQQCSAVFPDALQSHAVQGTLKLTDTSVQVLGGDTVLTFPAFKDNKPAHADSCGDEVACTISQSKSETLPLVNLNDDVNSDVELEVNSGEVITIGGGADNLRYKKIKVKRGGILNFTERPGEVYEIKDFELEGEDKNKAGGKVNFAPGQYAMNKAKMHHAEPIGVNGSGDVYLFIEAEFDFHGNFEDHSSRAGDFTIITNSNAKIKVHGEDNHKMFFRLYSHGELELKGSKNQDNGQIYGAFSGTNVELKENITVNYENVCEAKLTCPIPGWDQMDKEVCSGNLSVVGVEYTCSTNPDFSSTENHWEVIGDVTLNAGATHVGRVYAYGDILVKAGAVSAGLLHSASSVTIESGAVVTPGTYCPIAILPDDYIFTFDGTQPEALTCEPHLVNIQVRLDEQIDSSYSKLVNLSTSTNLGDWSAMQSNQGVLTNAGAGDATYKFENADNGAIELGLAHTESGLVQVEVSNVDATATYDINFATAVIKAEFSCNNYIDQNCINIANRPFDLTLTAITENPDTRLCENYDPVSIDFWSDYIMPSTAPSPALQKSVAINGEDIGKTIAEVTPIEVAFSGGVATLSANYPDAGKVKVNVRDTNQQEVNGSAEVVLNPHQLVVDQVTENVRNIQPGRMSSPDGFVRASVADYADLQVDTFDAQVIAIMDCTSAGTSSNCGSTNNENITPSFANNIELENTFFEPVGGTLGNLQYNNSDADLAKFEVLMEAGRFTYSDLAYDEVGSIKLQVKSQDYLGITDNDIEASSETEVGRFYPDYLAYGNFNAVPAHGGSEGFTYMDQQQIKMSYVLQAAAQSSALKVTINYDQSMGYPVASDYSAEIEDIQAVSLTGRLLSEDAYVVNNWVNGIYMIDSGEEYNVGLARPATILGQPAPDGPYFNEPAVNDGNLVNYYFRVVGQDGEQLQPIDLNETCNAEFCLFGELGDIVYGRMLAENTHGSEYLALRAPVSATYFDGVGFPTFTRDSYSTFTFGQLATSPTKNLAAEVAISDSNGKSGITTVSIPSGVTILSDGIGYIHFSAPTNAVRGKLKYFVEYESVAPWLLDAHNRINCEADPTSLDCPSNSTAHYVGGSVQFGLFRGNDRIIYRIQTFD